MYGCKLGLYEAIVTYLDGNQPLRILWDPKHWSITALYRPYVLLVFPLRKLSKGYRTLEQDLYWATNMSCYGEDGFTPIFSLLYTYNLWIYTEMMTGYLGVVSDLRMSVAAGDIRKFYQERIMRTSGERE